MDWIIKVIGIAAVAVLFVNAEPLIRLKHFLLKTIKEYESKWYWRLLNCALCSGFWIGLAISTDIYIASTSAVLAEILHQKINNSI